jgi:CO/xanthine dehydrogenase FAD-binding subunit
LDLNTITEIATPRRRSELGAWRSGDAWLGGGTWLFSEPQPHLSRLIDLAGLGWPSLRLSHSGLEIAATCRIAELDALALPAAWTAAPLINQCCRAFLASFKIWNMATVGGNVCMALPAGPMISLAVALDGSCLILTPGGAERRVAITDFVTGPQRNALAPGEVLRAIELPAAALARRTAFRQISLAPLGRSAALLVGTRGGPDGRFALTVTAATARPLRIGFENLPSAQALARRIGEEIADELWFSDPHGTPAWRRHMTLEFAEQIRRELST